MALVVEYVNAKGDSRVAPLLVKDIYTYPGYILCGWCIHGNATETAGTITFAIHFYQCNIATHKIVYSLRTKPVSSKILHGVATTELIEETGLSNSIALQDFVAAIA